jgi:hypothetical protein
VRALVGVAMLFAAAASAGAANAGNLAVDWGKGVVTAEGVGVADRHAPNPAVARGTSRRAAEAAARTQLRAKLGELPVAGGGTVAERSAGNGANAKDITARLDAAVANAIAVAAQPETDGAWRVTMAVPIEAVRQALDGPRALPATGDRGDAAVIVDGVKAKPAIGWTVAGKHVATVWLDSPTAGGAKHVTATKAANGAIEVDLAGTTATDATLFVIITKP